MQVFDPRTFRQFVGVPVSRTTHSWGIEERYVIAEASLADHEEMLRQTLDYHHSSCDVGEEVRAMGHRRAAVAVRQRNSGNPVTDKMQMGNLAEVIGAEFARAYLGFDTSVVPPKRLNTNIDQSMKGPDIIGLRDSAQPPELLIGEARCGKQFGKRSIGEAYDYLVELHAKKASRILRYVKETICLRRDKDGLVNVDRHMADGVPRRYIIVSITQSAPPDPFGILAEKFARVQLPSLMAVHIQIHGLRGSKAQEGQDGEETWLSSLFTP
jgi:hypothetical protein